MKVSNLGKLKPKIMHLFLILGKFWNLDEKIFVDEL